MHTVFPHPRRHYRLSRTPPTIVRGHLTTPFSREEPRQGLPLHRIRESRAERRRSVESKDRHQAQEHQGALRGDCDRSGDRRRIRQVARGAECRPEATSTRDLNAGAMARRRAAALQRTRAIGQAKRPREARAVGHATTQVPSNGEVEGPHRSARSEPRVHTLFPHPRRHYRPSRTPPTIVRSQVHTAPTSLLEPAAPDS